MGNQILHFALVCVAISSHPFVCAASSVSVADPALPDIPNVAFASLKDLQALNLKTCVNAYMNVAKQNSSPMSDADLKRIYLAAATATCTNVGQQIEVQPATAQGISAQKTDQDKYDCVTPNPDSVSDCHACCNAIQCGNWQVCHTVWVITIGGIKVPMQDCELNLGYFYCEARKFSCNYACHKGTLEPR